jgi:hypothetical protein
VPDRAPGKRRGELREPRGLRKTHKRPDGRAAFGDERTGGDGALAGEARPWREGRLLSKARKGVLAVSLQEAAKHAKAVMPWRLRR